MSSSLASNQKSYTLAYLRKALAPIATDLQIEFVYHDLAGRHTRAAEILTIIEEEKAARKEKIEELQREQREQEERDGRHDLLLESDSDDETVGGLVTDHVHFEPDDKNTYL